MLNQTLHNSEAHVHVEGHRDTEIEIGDTYGVSVSECVPKSRSLTLGLKTGPQLLHLTRVVASCQWNCVACSIFESPELKLTSGKTVIFQNRKRSRKNQSGCALLFQPELFRNHGTILEKFFAQNVGRMAGDLILKPDTQYLFAVLNMSGRFNETNLCIYGHVD